MFVLFWRFLHTYATVAQPVEQGPLKPKVLGSIPSRRTTQTISARRWFCLWWIKEACYVVRMTPREIKARLEVLQGGGRPNKSLGQHFLIDPGALRAIVEAAAIHKGEMVLEVGPGLGVLTRALASVGAQVLAIEQDRRFLDEVAPVARVIHGNAVEQDWDALIGDVPWKFVSNLPYSITSFALRKALWETRPPERVVVLIQREVAERCIETAERPKGKTSLLSLMIALACSSARIVKRVPPGAFFPPPKVDSSVLELIPRTQHDRQALWGIDPEAIMQFAKKGFAHPRKQLASNLGGEEGVKLALLNITGSERVRAEDLTPTQWAELAKQLA